MKNIKINLLLFIGILAAIAAVSFFITRALYQNVYSRMKNEHIDLRIDQAAMAKKVGLPNDGWFKGKWSRAQRVKALDEMLMRPS